MTTTKDSTVRLREALHTVTHEEVEYDPGYWAWSMDEWMRDALRDAAKALADAPTVDMRNCCTNGQGEQMVSPLGFGNPVVSGNGECAEFVLPEGVYALVRVGDLPDDPGT